MNFLSRLPRAIAGAFSPARIFYAGMRGAVPFIFSKSSVPVYIAATGTMADNGAITLGTALGRIYTGGLWLYLPANAISAGSAAGFYWTVMSSTTVGTVFNSTYAPGAAPALGTTTAFVTTGPGAFTGVTGAITAVSLTLAANSMGANGGLETLINMGYTNSAGSKAMTFNFGGIAYLTTAYTTTVASRKWAEIYNAGRTNLQVGGPDLNANWGPSGTAAITSAADTTAAVTVTIVLNKNTATDNMGLEGYRIVLMSDGT